MRDNERASTSEIIVKVPVEPSADRKRIAASLVALLRRGGIAAEVVIPDDPPDPSDDGTPGAAN